MFNLVGKIKLAFLDQRCQHTNIYCLLLTTSGRDSCILGMLEKD